MAALFFDVRMSGQSAVTSRSSLQGYLWLCLHEASLQALQAVVTLSVHHILQNSPQFIVECFEVCTPRKPVLGAEEG